MPPKNDRIIAERCAREDSGPFLSVVVPCFNESEGLPELHRRVAATCSGLFQPYEIVLVNDGSTDATWSVMKDLCQRDCHIVAINFSRNFGQQAALTAGLAHARGKRILVLDADLQDPPELLPAMLALVEDGADVVHGRRRSRAGETWLKRVTAWVFYRLLARWSNRLIVRDVGEFRLLTRRAADAVLGLPERHRFMRGLVGWVGFRQASIDYDRAERFAGATHWPLGKMARLATDAITAFSSRPLELSAWIGLAACAVGAGLLTWFAAAWLLFGYVLSALGLLACFSLLSGLQMSMLGILGAYVGRLYEESCRRPLFIVSDIISAATRPSANVGDGTDGSASLSPKGMAVKRAPMPVWKD